MWICPDQERKKNLMGTAAYEQLYRKLISSFYTYVGKHIDAEVAL